MHHCRLVSAVIALIVVSLPTTSFIKERQGFPERREATPLLSDLASAIKTGDWEIIDRTAAALLTSATMRDLASIVRGYAALARADSITGAQHFLRVGRIDLEAEDVKWARSLLESAGDNSIGRLIIGDVLVRSGAVDEGLAQFRVILSREPDFVLARLALVAAKSASGTPEGCEDNERLRLDDTSRTDGLILDALLDMSQGRVAEAVERLNTQAQTRPGHPIVHHTLGLLYARRQDWVSAASEFEDAFHAAPGLAAARRNWAAVVEAESRGTAIAAEYKLGVFATGIQSEADCEYAKTHAQALASGREQAFLYVGVRGAYPNAGEEKARRQGFQTLVADPHKPDTAIAQIDRFIQSSVAAGKNPEIFIDVNKLIPTQLGNHKPASEEFPAALAVAANRSFAKAIGESGNVGSSVFAGHSDGTRIVLKGSTMASQEGKPFGRVILESPRSEVDVANAVRASPRTEFTVVQPKRGDLFTQEAQQRFLGGDRGAYQKSVEYFKEIDAPNYRAAVIENPSRSSPSALNWAGAHNDPASYGRWSEVAFWRGGKVVGKNAGTLGEMLATGTSSTPPTAGTPPKSGVQDPTVRGGVWLSFIDVQNGTGGRIVFGDGSTASAELQVVYPIFGSAEWADVSKHQVQIRP